MSWGPLTVAAGGAMALLLGFLIPFPATLFNKTVDANQDEISRWLAALRRRAGGVPFGLGRWLNGLFGVLVFLVLSALVFGFLSPSFGLDRDSVAVFLGLLIGLAFITATFDLPLRVFHRTVTGDLGRLRALWWTLPVAVACVVISRLANFEPGYLYGLVITIAFATEVAEPQEGLGVWFASAWLLGLSVVAWLLLGAARSAGGDPWISTIVQTALVMFVVAGIETLAVGLIPLRFMPGHPVYETRRKAWFVMFALAVIAYLLILVDPFDRLPLRQQPHPDDHGRGLPGRFRDRVGRDVGLLPFPPGTCRRGSTGRGARDRRRRIRGRGRTGVADGAGGGPGNKPGRPIPRATSPDAPAYDRPSWLFSRRTWTRGATSAAPTPHRCGRWWPTCGHERWR